MSNFNKFMEFFDGHKTFQLFGDKADLPPMVLENPEPNELVRLNAKGYGIFLTVNETDGKGRSASNVIRVRAVFADLDGCSPSKMMDDMPHLVVKSSTGKFHGYWFVLSDFPLAGFRGIQKAIAWRYGSDGSVNDLPRVLRVAGFYHQKNEPCKTEVVWINENQTKLSYEDCVAKFPPEPVKQWTKKQTTQTESFDVGYSIPELLSKYGWTYYHGEHWTRPGKDHGVSGTIMESGLFYVFTSSTCLKPNSICDAFELMAQYDFGGDKKRTAKYVLENR